MVEFQSWKDMYLFLQKYYNCSCLQCKHYSKKLNENKTYSDTEYARFFCPHQIAMVRLDFQITCHEWENENGDKLSKNKAMYKFSDEIADTLDSQKGKLSIEEIEKIINN